MAISWYVVAAICGNFSWESTVNPGIYEDLTVIDITNPYVYGGYGLGQWTNTSDASLHRRTDMTTWLSNNGYAYDSGDGQMAFLLYENHWSQNIGPYATLTDFLNSDSTNIDYLTNIWMRCWEGINSHLGDRQQFANNVYQYLIDHYTDSGITSWVTGNFYLSDAQKKNNSVMVARALLGGSPPPPGPPPTSDDDFLPIMKLGMLIK